MAKSVRKSRGAGDSEKVRSGAHGGIAMEVVRLRARLEEADLRVTQPRLKLIEILLEEHGPFTVDEILAMPGARSMDRVTVYRNLQSFEEAGIVRRCEFGDGASRFEIGSDDHHHHHVICRKCRKSETLDLCVPDSLLRQVRKLGYEGVSHSLEFFGVCPRCLAR